MSTPSIEDVLLRHEYRLGLRTGCICECGYVPPRIPDSLWSQQDHHRAHVADAIRAHLAEHTDEAAGAVERVRKLADEWAEDIGKGHEMNPNGHYALSTHERDLDELRAALAGGASGAEGAE